VRFVQRRLHAANSLLGIWTNISIQYELRRWQPSN
jgi:hypothetical protein